MTLKELRLQARLRKSDLSKDSGVSVSTITRIENSVGSTSEITVLDLLDVLSKKLDRVLSINDVDGLKLEDPKARGKRKKV